MMRGEMGDGHKEEEKDRLPMSASFYQTPARSPTEKGGYQLRRLKKIFTTFPVGGYWHPYIF